MKRYITGIRIKQGGSVKPEDIVEIRWRYENGTEDGTNAVDEIVALLWPEDQEDDDGTTVEFWVKDRNTDEEWKVRAVHPDGAAAVLMSGCDRYGNDHLLSLPRLSMRRG